MTSFLIDGFLIIMLAGTLTYAVIVHCKLRKLMSLLQDLEPLVLQFSAAVDKSEKSVSNMKQAAQAVVEKPAETSGFRTALEGLTFRSQRSKPQAIIPRFRSRDVPGATRINGKADLVKSFFDTNLGQSSW